MRRSRCLWMESLAPRRKGSTCWNPSPATIKTVMVMKPRQSGLYFCPQHAVHGRDYDLVPDDVAECGPRLRSQQSSRFCLVAHRKDLLELGTHSTPLIVGEEEPDAEQRVRIAFP